MKYISHWMDLLSNLHRSLVMCCSLLSVLIDKRSNNISSNSPSILSIEYEWLRRHMNSSLITSINLHRSTSLQNDSSRNCVHNLTTVIKLSLQLVLSYILVLNQLLINKSGRSLIYLRSVSVLKSDVLSIGITLSNGHISLGRSLEGRLGRHLQQKPSISLQPYRSTVPLLWHFWWNQYPPAVEENESWRLVRPSDEVQLCNEWMISIPLLSPSHTCSLLPPAWFYRWQSQHRASVSYREELGVQPRESGTPPSF